MAYAAKIYDPAYSETLLLCVWVDGGDEELGRLHRPVAELCPRDAARGPSAKWRTAFMLQIPRPCTGPCCSAWLVRTQSMTPKMSFVKIWRDVRSVRTLGTTPPSNTSCGINSFGVVLIRAFRTRCSSKCNVGILRFLTASSEIAPNKGEHWEEAYSQLCLTSVTTPAASSAQQRHHRLPDN